MSLPDTEASSLARDAEARSIGGRDAVARFADEELMVWEERQRPKLEILESRSELGQSLRGGANRNVPTKKIDCTKHFVISCLQF